MKLVRKQVEKSKLRAVGQTPGDYAIKCIEAEVQVSQPVQAPKLWWDLTGELIIGELNDLKEAKIDNGE